jgi:hypothetical protein
VDRLSTDLPPRQGAGTPPAGHEDEMGPWCSRLMLACSRDGLTFSRTFQALGDQIGVPSAVVDSEGHLRVYYMDYGNGNALAVAIRTHTGRWIHRRVSLHGVRGSPGPVDPMVVPLAEGRLRMYYMQADSDRSAIYSALSWDGLAFQEEPGRRFSTSGWIFDPFVLETPAGWLLVCGPEGRHSARSGNGLSFAADLGPFVVDGKPFMPYSGVRLSQGCRLYGSSSQPGEIVSVISPDGVRWSREPGVRLESRGLDPRQEEGILPDHGLARLPDGTYVMAYLAIIPGSVEPQGARSNSHSPAGVPGWETRPPGAGNDPDGQAVGAGIRAGTSRG